MSDKCSARALRLSLIAATLGLFTMIGCGHSQPSWVEAGSRAVAAESGEVVYGVGSARGIRNSAQARAVAESRARLMALELVRSGGKSGFVRGTLHGMRIIDHWQSRDGRFFALAVYQR